MMARVYLLTREKPRKRYRLPLFPTPGRSEEYGYSKSATSYIYKTKCECDFVFGVHTLFIPINAYKHTGAPTSGAKAPRHRSRSYRTQTWFKGRSKTADSEGPGKIFVD